MGILDKLFGPPDIKKLKENKDVKGLIEALKHDDQGIRERAAYSLHEIADKKAVVPLIKALKNSQDVPKYIMYYTPEQRGWLEDLAKEEWDVRRGVAFALSKIGKPAVEPLIKLLEDSNNNIRFFAINALGIIGDERAVEPLIDALNDKDTNVRRITADALGKIGDKKAVEPLIEALLEGPYTFFHKKVCIEAIRALGKIGDERAVEPLTDALKDKDEHVREAAEKALEKIKAKKS